LPYDPLRLSEETVKIVTQGMLRKYYRTSRHGRWYGGIASADCCGCNLRCVFCWSGAPRDHPEGIGAYYSPQQIFDDLAACAKKFGYTQLRVSGIEPTIGQDHLLKLLALIDQTVYRFILETNGILIGHDEDYARQLSRYKCVHVRLSIKGTNRKEFSRLTGAVPEAFDLQLKALENLLYENVPCHPAIMLSFSSKENLYNLKNRIRQIDSRLAEEIEEEYVILYPHVVERLRKAGITPEVAHRPNRVPRELV
jgi:uncharacterized Fe-S cluster-containing radical SAM superfamily protein